MTSVIRKYIIAAAMSLLAVPSVMAQDYETLAKKAMDYVMQDSLVQAELYFKKALKLDPASSKNALIFSNLGSVQKRLGKVDDALESYTMALNITPYATSILLNRASLYLDLGHLEKAYIDYCQVIDLIPDNVEARLFRAYIYMLKRQYQEARIDYNVVLAKDHNHRTARLGMIMLDQNENKLRSAFDGVSKMIEETPADVTLYQMRANIAQEMGMNEAALLDLEEVVRINDDYATYIQIGDLNLSLKHKAEARKAYEQAVALGVPREQLRDKLKMCR